MAYEDILEKLKEPDLPGYPPPYDADRPSGLPFEGYYYSAYGIAVKHGYVGTEEEWLASLKGERGFYTELRYDSDTNYLQQKHEGETEWHDLMSLTELQTELEAAIIEEVEDARDAAEGYASAAESSATLAAGSASAAWISASAAATSAENAESYKDAASASASAAEESAGAAENSATDASGYATAAAGSATAAEAAVTAAESAQTAAETAKASAESAQASAETASANAQTSATNADSSATAASGSATAAAGSASSASGSAASAASAKTAAETAQSAAETAQSAAETAATTATTKAGEAASSASAASDSAEDAASSASAAAASETNAANSEIAAATAKTGAEAARDAILTLNASATVDSNVGTPSVNVTVSGDSPKSMAFAFHNIKGVQGEQGIQGNPGDDGVSPTVTVTTIAGGHRVTVTDAQGTRYFDVLDGEGSGDMMSSVYDEDSAVAGAGGIAAYVDANGGKIDTIKRNGTALPITDKTVNITVPTSASDVGADPAGSASAVQSNLQAQIDAIVSKSDVVDVVEVYDRGATSKTDIVHYNTSSLFANDVVKVMQDETNSNAISYFKWSGTVWSYIGSQGPFYTKGETDALLNGKQSTISDLATIRDNAAAGAAKISCTESTVAGYGFTKNTGTYSKPSTGIPKEDLSSAVQSSLNKADTALQGFTESDPTVPSWAKQTNKPSYTASEVGAVPTTRNVNGYALSSDVTLSAGDVGADVSGAASSAVSTHNSSNNAHSSLFAGKQPTISDLDTIRSGAAAGATAVQPSALDNYIPTSQKGAANGIASLGSDGKVPTSQLPIYDGSVT